MSRKFFSGITLALGKVVSGVFKFVTPDDIIVSTRLRLLGRGGGSAVPGPAVELTLGAGDDALQFSGSALVSVIVGGMGTDRSGILCGDGATVGNVIYGAGLSFTSATRTLSLTGGSGVAIGDPVGSGTANYILFVDGSGDLGQSSGFQWNDSTKAHAVVGDGGSTAYTVTITSGATVTKFGAASTSGIAAHFENGTYTVELASGSGGFTAAGYFTDGTHTVKIADGTNNITYTAAVAGNWAASTPPTDVWIALDRIAAALAGLLSPP